MLPLFLLGCAAWVVDSPPPPEAVDPTFVDTDSRDTFVVPVGHCHASERTRFSCSLGPQRVVSLCERSGFALYVGQPRGTFERLPAQGVTTALIASRRSLGPTETTVVSVFDGDRRLALELTADAGGKRGRLVERDAQGVRSSACASDLVADLDDLVVALPGAAGDPRSWAGDWSGPDGSSFELRAEGSEAIESLVLHAGALETALTLGEGAWHAGPPCDVRLRRLGGDLIHLDQTEACPAETLVSGAFFRLP